MHNMIMIKDEETMKEVCEGGVLLILYQKGAL